MSVNKRVRVGVAGAGKMGQNHIRILSQMIGTFELAGIYDPLPEKRKIAEQYGVPFFDDFVGMLKEVDAVTLPCPTSLHKEMALKAADMGVHTLVEKPISERLEDAKHIQQVFENKGLLLTAGHVERFNPVVTALLEILKDMEPIAIEVHRCSPFDKRIFDVDVVLDLMIHDIDIVVNGIEGSLPRRVAATGRRVYTDRFADYAQAVLEFSDGVQAFITTSRSTEDKIRMIAVHAKGAYIEANMLDKTLIIKRGTNYDSIPVPHITYRQSSVTEHVVLQSTEPLREELLNFGNAILKGTPLLIDGKQIIRAMTVIDEVEKKIYSRKEGIA